MSTSQPTIERDPGIDQRSPTESHVSALPGERIPATTAQRAAVIALSTLAILFLLNFAVTSWLNKTVPNEGYRKIRQKWSMLDNLGKPVDNVILGDSSGAQGFDPLVLSQNVGGSSFNFCTVGDMTVVDDAAMLDEYVRRYGAPKRVVMVHVFDVWNRQITGYALAQTPLVSKSPALAWWPRANASDLKREMFLARNVKLFSESKSVLAEVVRIVKPSKKDKGGGVRSDGFSLALTNDPAQLAKDVKDHIATASTIDPAVSPDNAAALQHIGALSNQYGFPVYVVNGPISEEVMRDATFASQYAKAVANVAAEAQRNGLTFLLQTPTQFPGEEMDNVDHLTYAGAQKFTSEVARQILSLELRSK